MKLWGLASLFLCLAGIASADPHPRIPPSAVPHAEAGKALWSAKCAVCHSVSTNENDVLTGASVRMWEAFSQYPANFDQQMIYQTNMLTAQQLDDISVFLAQQDPAYYTVQGNVTDKGSPLSGVKVVLTTEYKMGTNLYFPAQTTYTDSQGKYSFKTWAGRKTLTVSKTGFKFMPSQRTKVELACDIVGFGTYDQGNIKVTASQGPDGPILSGEVFKTLQFYSNQVSKTLPWMNLKPKP